MKNFLLSLVAGSALLVSVASSHAAPLLQVDYNNGTSATNTQPGWTGVALSSLGPSSYNTNFLNELGGNATATISNLLGAVVRDRGDGNPPVNGAFTLNRLYQDMAMNSTGVLATQYIDLSFSGLTPNTQYVATFYSYDNSNKGNDADFFDTTSGSVAIGSILGDGTAPDSNTDNALTVTRSSSAAGLLSFREVSQVVSQATTLNGFQISVVPEPSTWALLLTSGVVLVFLRRRRSA